MASGTEIAGAVAGAAPAIPALIGGGKVNRNATGFYNQPGYDPNASRWGGYAGGLRDYQAELARRRNQIDSRGAFLANYGPADHYAGLGLDARNQQGTVAQLMLARAQGQVPSIAQQQADRQMGQAVSAQNSLAASARGRAGLALAGRARAAGVANVQSGISNQAQINAAMERERAEGNAFGAFGNMRQGDVQSQGLAANMAQFQAQQQQANRNANDQRAFGQEQLEAQAMGNELQARTAQQGQLANAHASAEQANQRSAEQNARSSGLIENIGDLFSDERAKFLLGPGGSRITSDFSTKMVFGSNGGGGYGSGGGFGSLAGQGFDVGSGPAATSFEKFEMKGGKSGLDVNNSLRAHSDFATRYAGDATGGMHGSNLLLDLGSAARGIAAAPMGGAGEILSDERAKREAFVAGANYAEENRNVKPGGKQSPMPEYMRPREMKSFVREESTPDPEVSAVDRDYKGERERQRAVHAAQMARPPAPQIVVVPAQPAPSPAPTLMSRMVSDFTAKMPTPSPPGQRLMLSRGGSNGAPTTGDPLAPKMQFSPSRGWFDPVGDEVAAQRQAAEDAFDDDLRSTTEEDIRRSETSRLAAQGNAMDPNEQWRRSFGDPEVAKTQASFDVRNQTPFGGIPKDTNIAEAAKIRASFGQGEEPSMTDMFTTSLNRFAEASDRQKRRAAGGYDYSDARAKIVSDFTAKDAVDRAELGEIQRMRQPTSFRRDTDADRARVKKAYEDKAGRDADDMLAGYKRSLNEGSSVGPVDEIDDSPLADAARAMEGQPYVYKREFTPPDQKPGEMNYGFMTQNLRKNPITATAVKTDPRTGLDTVDAHKAIKVMASTIANLQEQQDETRLMLAKGGKRRRAA